MKKILTLLFVAVLCTVLQAQSTTVTGTITDTPDAVAWASGTWAAHFSPAPGAVATQYTWTGGAFTTYDYSGTLNGSGAFSQSLPSTSAMTYTGAQAGAIPSPTWTFTICPNASTGCFQYSTTITGGSQSLSTPLSAAAASPRFTCLTTCYGYSTGEITGTLLPGVRFFNTTTVQPYIYNGTAWQAFQSTSQINALGNTVNVAANLLDDFCGNTPSVTATIGQLGWDKTVLVAGTNPVAAIASVANHPCLITLTTNTTATNGVGITLGNAVGVVFPGATAGWQSEQIVKINQITSGSYRVGFGTVDSATAIPTNGIYFRFLNGTDTFINACSDSTGTETCTATTITPTAGDYVDFFMNSTVVGTVNFTVQDITTPAVSTVSLCGSGCTAVATVPTVVLSPMFNIAETGSSAADVLTVDYFAFNQAVTR